MRMKAKTEDVFEDELDLNDIKEKKKEMVRLKMEKELLKMQAETEKLRQELEKYKSGNSGNPSSSNPQASAVAALTATLIKSGVKPEEANEFLSKLNPEALATLTALTSNNPYLPLFMFLASQSKGQQPQNLTVKDIVEVNKNVFDLAKNIASDRGKSGESEILAIVKELTNMYKETQQKILLEKLEDIASTISSRKSLWDEILEDERKFNKLKQLFGGQNMSPEIAIELEKLRQAHELNMKKLDLELLKMQAELAESKRRKEMTATILRKIGEAIGTGLSEASKEVEVEPEEYSYTLKCPQCGTELKDVTPGKEITCPQCKTTYKAMVKG